jgi:UPF0755 protein
VEEKEMKKGFAFLLLIVLGLGGYVYLQFQPVVSSGQGTEIAFTISEGSGGVKIAHDLEIAGIIRSRYAFRYIAKQTGMENQFRPGTYQVQNDQPLEVLMQGLTNGPGLLRETIRVTIPEGYTLDEIVGVLLDHNLGNQEGYEAIIGNESWLMSQEFPKEVQEFNSLEGLLYPETYEFFADDSEEKILTKMIHQFTQVYGALTEDDFRNVNQVTTLASMIQGEGKVAEEFPLIASVFLNRIDIKMPLQSCATIQFVLGERKERLLNTDLEIDSPYNTYMYAGFPPGPVGSPGKTALVAALSPAETSYLFFTSNLDGTGNHTFTETYEEHLAATHAARKKAGDE